MPGDALRALESSLLGALIMAPDTKTALEEAAGVFSPKFLSPVFGFPLWSALEAIASRGENGDLVALVSELTLTGQLENLGGIAAVADLVETCPDITGHVRFARDLARLEGRSQAQHAAKNIYDRIGRGEELNGEIEKLLEITASFHEARKEKTWEEESGSPLLDAPKLAAIKDQPIPYVLDPIAIRGSLTQLHGPPKGGKSVWALYLSVAGAIGQLPEGPLTVTSPLKVLYLGWEDQAPLVARRISAYSAGLGMGWVIPEGITFSYSPDLWLNLKAHTDMLERAISENKFDLVIIDTFSYAHAVDEDRATEIKPVMANLRRVARKTNCAILYIHHRRKSSEGISSTERARGSSAISAAADVVIDWGDRAGSNITPVDVLSKWGRSGQWEVEYLLQEDQSVKWEIRDRERRRGKGQARKQAVWDTLKALHEKEAKPIPGTQLVLAMKDQGLSKTKVYDYLKDLENDGKIKPVPNGNSTTYECL